MEEKTKKGVVSFPERKFNSDSKVWKFRKKLTFTCCLISRYVWTFSNNALMDEQILKQIPDDNWIIGIRYPNKKCDVQIGCSGSSKKNEASFTTAVREMSEELGIRPIPGGTCISCSGSYIKNKNTTCITTVYCLKTSSVEPVPDSDSKYYEAGKDIKTQKVFCLVHGTLKEVTEILRNLKTIQRSKDFPKSVVAIPKKLAIICIKLARQDPNGRDIDPLSI